MASPADSLSDAEAAGKERGKWSHKCDYLLTMTGYAVGLSNVWRFPYLCYIHGGGAFLVPYLLMLVLVGFPLFFLETSVGQFSSCSCITVFSVCPAFKGLGMTSVAVNMVTLTYYTVLVSFPVLFLAYSFTWDLPWDSCENSWNSANCTIGRPSEGADMGGGVSSAEEFFQVTAKKSKVQIYLSRKVLHISSGLDDISRVQWQIVAVTFLTTAFLFFCVFKGVRVMGKVVWFTAPFPFAMLLVLLARGISLPGAVDGIRFYIYPEFERLKEMKVKKVYIEVWAAAAMQIFYSLGPGWGSLISFGSYNMFHNRSTRDAVTVPVLNCTASILAGFVVFSVLGFMAKRAGVSVEDLTVAGPSLVFIVYPEAVSMMPVAPLWSVIFFLMLFFLGVDSCFAYLETSVICLLDEFPKLRERRGWVTFVICLISFSVTILFATDVSLVSLLDCEHSQQVTGIAVPSRASPCVPGRDVLDHVDGLVLRVVCRHRRLLLPDLHIQLHLWCWTNHSRFSADD
nr:sodium-dependent proline transporter-like [Penaeus vannamei]